jgi:hypothetical protein
MSIEAPFSLVPFGEIITGGLGAGQIELKAVETDWPIADQPKMPQKKDAPRLPRQEEIMKNTQPSSRRRSGPPDKRYEEAGGLSAKKVSLRWLMILSTTA